MSGFLWWLFFGLIAISCNREDLTEGGSIARPSSPGGQPQSSECPPPPDLSGFQVLINEVMVENVTTLDDGSGKFPPWIELYNPTETEIHLGNVALSNSLAQPGKWTIPCIPQAIIPARGFLIIYADGDTANPDDLHASFTLTPGNRRSEVVINKGSDSLSFDGRQLPPDRSVGRLPDGGNDIVVLDVPTPGRTNEDPAGPPPSREAKFVRGDANKSGKVNVTDLGLIKKAIFEPGSLPACPDRFDSNDDGAINEADVVFMSNALFLNGPTFPLPYPEAGFDPTPDALRCLEEQ